MDTTKKMRIVVGASAIAVGVVGSVYGGWAILSAILNSDPLTKFLLASAGSAAGLFTAFVAGKRD